MKRLSDLLPGSNPSKAKYDVTSQENDKPPRLFRVAKPSKLTIRNWFYSLDFFYHYNLVIHTTKVIQRGCLRLLGYGTSRIFWKKWVHIYVKFTIITNEPLKHMNMLIFFKIFILSRCTNTGNKNSHRMKRVTKLFLQECRFLSHHFWNSSVQ